VRPARRGPPLPLNSDVAGPRAAPALRGIGEWRKIPTVFGRCARCGTLTPPRRPGRRRSRRLAAVIVLGVVFAWSGLAAQPPARPYRIGILSNAFVPGIPPIMGLRAGLKAEGLEEGRGLSFDIRSTGSDEKKATALAAELAKANPDVIVALGEYETRA